jgi:maltose/moltooligosaccharide transporter
MSELSSLPKKRMTFWQIWNMSFGFFGIQFGFSLQNGNASRILSTFGADVEHLSLFWLAAPLTGLIVQPLVGHYSDVIWTSIGRRKPFILVGAVLAAMALIFMPNADLLVSILPALYIGAGILTIMDASFNVAMEPFRALVADLLPSDQRTLGFAIQTFLIGLGAVIGSLLPYTLVNYFGFEKSSATGGVPESVTTSFYIGAIVFLIAILVTALTTKEYPSQKKDTSEKSTKSKGLLQIFVDFKLMPSTMKQLGLVQFFSWAALFTMWVFTTSAVASHVYKLPLTDTSSDTYNDAGNWVGVIFGVYNGVAAIYALLLPAIAHRIGRKLTHAVSLVIGGLGLISIYFIQDPNHLIFSMVAVGIAWASILAMPYAILAGSIPPLKMGVYMGLFNFFITIPQIINGFLGGMLVKHVFGSQAIYSIVMAGIFLLIAAVCVRFVDDRDDTAVHQDS